MYCFSVLAILRQTWISYSQCTSICQSTHLYFNEITDLQHPLLFDFQQFCSPQNQTGPMTNQSLATASVIASAHTGSNPQADFSIKPRVINLSSLQTVVFVVVLFFCTVGNLSRTLKSYIYLVVYRIWELKLAFSLRVALQNITAQKHVIAEEVYLIIQMFLFSVNLTVFIVYIGFNSVKHSPD